MFSSPYYAKNCAGIIDSGLVRTQLLSKLKAVVFNLAWIVPPASLLQNILYFYIAIMIG